MPLLLLFVLAADPLSADVLRNAPGVEKVDVKGPENAKRRIIHICDWHFVEREAFGEEIDDQGYQKHVKQVEAVQAEQTKLLQHLIARHDLKTVHVEGFSRRDAIVIDGLVSIVSKSPLIANPTNDDEREYNSEVRTLRLKIGAEGQLAAAGKLKLVPVEDEEAYRAARGLDAETNEARESAIVRNLLATDEPVVFVVLGAAHDLSDNVPRDVEYIRVGTKRFPH